MEAGDGVPDEEPVVLDGRERLPPERVPDDAPLHGDGVPLRRHLVRACLHVASGPIGGVGDRPVDLRRELLDVRRRVPVDGGGDCLERGSGPVGSDVDRDHHVVVVERGCPRPPVVWPGVLRDRRSRPVGERGRRGDDSGHARDSSRERGRTAQPDADEGRGRRKIQHTIA